MKGTITGKLVNFDQKIIDLQQSTNIHINLKIKYYCTLFFLE